MKADLATLPSELADRLEALERRVADLESGGRPATWPGWSRSVLRWLAVNPPLLLLGLVCVDSLSAATSLPPGLLLAGCWATAAVLWAAVEVIAGGPMRFRVSRLVVIVAVLGGAMGYWRSSIYGPYAAERACLAGVKGIKGTVHTEPFGPTWLMGLFGDAHFRRVVQMGLDGPEVEQGEIGRLRSLPHLHTLFLDGPGFDDRVVDGLAALPAIRSIYLTDCLVSKAGIGRFNRLRPGVEIVRQGKVVDDPTRSGFQ